MKIILLRHGETTWNKERRLQGRRDIPLAPEGREQIRRTGHHLSQTIKNIDLILTSPLLRARESAGIVAEELNYSPEAILQAPLFIERNFGAGEGLTYEEALVRYPDSSYPGMETLEALYQRAEAAVHQYVEAYPDKTLLVVAHGAIIKAALVALTNGRITYFDEKVWINNGSYCLLDYQDDHWKISIHNNDNNYAPAQLQ